MTPMKRQAWDVCSNCKYWTDYRDVCGQEGIRIPRSAIEGDTVTVELGRCRRYAPHPKFAETREDDWCGEFEQI